MKIKAIRRLGVSLIVHQAEQGGYWTEVPALPGCITEGETMQELESNLKDPIEGWLEVANENHTVENEYLNYKSSCIKSIFGKKLCKIVKKGYGESSYLHKN